MFSSYCQITFWGNEYMLQVLSTTANPNSSYKLQFILHFQGKREDVLRNFTESSSTTLHFSDDELSVQSDLLAPSSLECSVKLFGTQIYCKVYDKLLQQFSNFLASGLLYILKEFTCQCKRHGFDPGSETVPWRKEWLSTLVFVHGKSMDRGAWRDTVHRVAKSRT